MSNYTTLPNYAGDDPLAFSQLLYENTPRLAMGSDYYSLILPYYMSTAIPDETGYHLWSYALKPWDPTKPSGSTDYSKLANVSILHDASPAAINASGLNGAPVDDNGNPIVFPPIVGVSTPFPQVWRHLFIAKNWNIARKPCPSFWTNACNSENRFCEEPLFARFPNQRKGLLLASLPSIRVC